MNPLLAHTDTTADRDKVTATSLVALLTTRVAEAGDRPAVVDGLAACERGDGAGAAATAWTWQELAAAALRAAESLEAAGLRRGDRVAHVGPHSPDWLVVDLACLLGGLVHVAIHHDLPRTEQERLLGWLAPRGVIRSGPDTVLRSGSRAPRAKTGIRLHDVAADARGPAAGSPVAIPGLAHPSHRSPVADHAGLLAELRRRAADCDPDACCTILLSSGTTGLPHGVLHSQRALAINAAATSEMFLSAPRDVRLSWLPLSHALARTGDLYTALVRGGCLNVVADRTRVLDACRTLAPTVILGVPVFFERLERAARAGRIDDLAAALGGSVRVCVSGGAALSRRTAEFFAARGVPLVEGYGLAEAGPVVAVSNPRIARPGTVGPPLPGVEVRIDERAGSRGQLLVRTPSRALGIVAPGESAEAVAAPSGDADPEWLETGDLAELDDAGHIRLTGRLRDTLVLATGMKLPPAAVEQPLAEDEAVAQVCVAGDGLAWPVALVVPEPAVLRAAMRRLGVRVFSRAAALSHPRVLRWLGRRLARRQQHLPRGWQVRRVILVGRAFDAAHGEATESLKLKRRVIEMHFRERIDQAAATVPPAWAGVVPVASGRATAASAVTEPVTAWLPAAVWHAQDGGFAATAQAAAEPLCDAIAAVLHHAETRIADLRATGELYDRADGIAMEPPPLVDAPARPVGRFAAAAEEALGDTGLWGLAVPETYGGSSASLGDLARVITRLAANCPTAAGMLAVHSSIGAVASLTAFGSAAQRGRHLPALAAGSPLSIFAATEPDVGCDLGAVRAVLERTTAGLRLTGTKMFITSATYGRLAKVLALLDGRPAVALVRLPAADTGEFRLLRYGLHPLKHAHNAALEFTGFPVDEDDLLVPPPGRDGMQIVWHGLNRGRVTLAAQAAGTLRLLLSQAREHAARRSTWGRPIAARELVQGRLGRIAAAIVACDAMAAWAAAAIDAGQTGELEAIAAKVVASTCVREAAIDALGVHGGRAFLVGHPLGDAWHDHFAVTVYEGESDLLGLALFKGICRHHPLAGPMRDGSTWRRATGWLAWRAGQFATGTEADREDRPLLDGRLRAHARHARRQLASVARQIDRAIRRHGRSLPDRQLEIGDLAAQVRELVSVLAVAHHADAGGEEAVADAADVWCRLALARAAGRRPSAGDHAAVAAVGRRAITASDLTTR